jgi:transcriptional regulator with XRE-family HTH domain
VTVVEGAYVKERRHELAAFLRSCRERVNPRDVGLAPGLRRRTPGLRREEVAQLAGVGVTWYTWLEQGRPINVSVQVLDAVARVLSLGPAERWHLYRLADVPGVPVGVDSQTLPDDVPEVLDALEPLPACVYNGKYDVLACNGSYAAMFPQVLTATGRERNALWQIFALRNCPLRDTGLLAHMVATLRANYARQSESRSGRSSPSGSAPRVTTSPRYGRATKWPSRFRRSSPSYAPTWVSSTCARPATG